MKSKITEIYLNDNKLDDECMKSLGEFIEKNKTIEEIEISNNKLTGKGVDILVPSFKETVSLKKLDLMGNEGITVKSISRLMNVAKNTRIQAFRQLNPNPIRSTNPSPVVTSASAPAPTPASASIPTPTPTSIPTPTSTSIPTPTSTSIPTPTSTSTSIPAPTYNSPMFLSYMAYHTNLNGAQYPRFIPPYQPFCFPSTVYPRGLNQLFSPSAPHQAEERKEKKIITFVDPKTGKPLDLPKKDKSVSPNPLTSQNQTSDAPVSQSSPKKEDIKSINHAVDESKLSEKLQTSMDENISKEKKDRIIYSLDDIMSIKVKVEESGSLDDKSLKCSLNKIILLGENEQYHTKRAQKSTRNGSSYSNKYPNLIGTRDHDADQAKNWRRSSKLL